MSSYTWLIKAINYHILSLFLSLSLSLSLSLVSLLPLHSPSTTFINPDCLISLMKDLQALNLWLSFSKTLFVSYNPCDEVFVLNRPVEPLRLCAA
jgi:hypothetical protein